MNVVLLQFVVLQFYCTVIIVVLHHCCNYIVQRDYLVAGKKLQQIEKLIQFSYIKGHAITMNLVMCEKSFLNDFSTLFANFRAGKKHCFTAFLLNITYFISINRIVQIEITASLTKLYFLPLKRSFTLKITSVWLKIFCVFPSNTIACVGFLHLLLVSVFGRGVKNLFQVCFVDIYPTALELLFETHFRINMLSAARLLASFRQKSFLRIEKYFLRYNFGYKQYYFWLQYAMDK